MIFADKVVQLRKKSGWSQEELAEKLNVTRQSVSKWEGAQSIPDLEKILQLAQIFGVSTDYLLKDELAEAEYTESDDSSSVRRVSMEEANAFLQVKQATAGRIAFATFLCILSPICLFLLAAASETGMLPSVKIWPAARDDRDAPARRSCCGDVHLLRRHDEPLCLSGGRSV